MTNTIFTLTNWIIAKPRIVLFIVLLTIVMVFAVMPVLAGHAPSGSYCPC